MVPSIARRLLCGLFVLLALAAPGAATWSIVAVNLRTGEVAVASATCIPSINLRRETPVIVVGKGAAAAQSLLDVGAVNRSRMYDALVAGVLTPAEILESLRTDGSYQQRQYGIAAFTGDPVSFTGRRAGAAASGVTGMVDGYCYAVQGNVLTDDLVVTMAAEAFRDTKGDMGQRLMAAMEAARALGGDGRCSCSNNNPTGCGAPPASFEKSAHVGYVIVARMGDQDKPCSMTNGCARGTYYLTLNVAGASAEGRDPDPVEQLQAKYANWRALRMGRADGIHSRVEAVQSLPADGVTQSTVLVRLADVDGIPLTSGGAVVDVSTVDGEPSLVSIGAVTDHGDGTYSFPLTAGVQEGTDELAIRVDDGSPKVVTLYPYLTVRSDPADLFHVGYDEVSAAGPVRVPFTVHEPASAGARYVVLASLSGSQPGSVFGEIAVPLNPPIFSVPQGNVDAGRLPGTYGRLDDRGRAEAAFVAGPRFLTGLIGRRIDWAVVVGGGEGLRASAASGFDVVP